ncbi:MAG: hypothetical protein UX12_C0013G0007 [Candidatus Collierbacteria bacterium GW2011_GWC1_45_47]|uniref:Uncharacterized protein n=5 Tax=Candidatus Collieribacteriota TaxID=1752725 RepID=A0A0G1HFU5_9BACT|nr:MAG: hypothetical protein UW23_C0019G0033 [Candidatus Collierbacteria bacterium GW2011_GWA1_44_12]KKT46176.1 MAG: hypothetical protein UW35_C0020G0009 [Candidatus Collierbacteria bacterium GW2011_GWF2_44_15]KKT99180.1 MAG: hypothetical protein UW99_C0008G0009 [Candidatus Collierbacteria bacterium GW2011_GWC2_45_15]KKU09432.1 MAG: hypothetical protein UX12_C0013G0007 [Candidatus Collierbacteria bacterium GW2011_GWC1_45_47]KKU29585.1 MAG: hypothetical protein UX41_C0015G0019 [Candidatus Collie
MPTTNLARSIANLEKRSESVRSRLLKNKTAKNFFKKSSLIAFDLREKSGRLLAGAGLVGTLLALPLQPPAAIEPIKAVASQDALTQRQKLLTKIQDVLPHNPSKLTPEGATTVEEMVKEHTGITAKAYLEGQSLNHHLGYMGFEQHLKRYPGDSLAQHDEIQEAGMAPGLGAWGYFARDANQFTTKDYLNEKYYVAVQTLYLENWNQDFAELRDWYKNRKVLVINPVNGKAVVAVIGDAGPAEWTGKQFGGSPEVMQALDLHLGPRKGATLLLFVDDPDNRIPLGPVNY